MRFNLKPFPVLAALGAASLVAQTPVTGGLTAGAAKLTDLRSEQALTGVLQLQASSWLTLSAMPSVVHVSDSVGGRSVSSSGAADLPLSADASYTFPGPASPVVAAALTVVLATGNASCGLGSGETSVDLDVGVEASAGSQLHLSADASRSVGGLSAQSILSAPHATSLRAEAGYDVSPVWTADVSLGIDVGQSDSSQALSRVVGAGVIRHLAGALALTVDGSAGLTSTSPKWVVSVGLGTAFGGTSPVGLTAPLRRLKSTFAGGVNRGNGSGKIGCR